MIKRMVFSLAAVVLPFAAFPSSDVADSLRYEVEVRSSFDAGRHNPLWLASNLDGFGTPVKGAGYLRGGVFKDAGATSGFSWGAGLEAAGLWNAESPFLIRQLYGELRYRSVSAFAGSKVTRDSFLTSPLSSGGMLYSGNALPVPQLRVGIFDYADVWGCKGWLAARGYVAYGKFTDSSWQRDWVEKGTRYTEGVLYNSRGLWFRGGNQSKFPLTGEIGIEMATQFGGRSIDGNEVIRMPRNLKAWLKAMLPGGGSASTPEGERVNVEGNQLGVYDMALSWNDPRGWSVRCYMQHYFEDQSQMTFEYGWKDALLGIQATLPRNPFVNEIVYEYLATKDQSGPVFNNSTAEVPEQVSGQDFYYDHYIYSGWQHWGNGMGNPLLISPLYNNPHLLRFMDTRAIAHHFGFSGMPSETIAYRVLLSHSRNWGTYLHPYPEVLDNFSGMVELGWTPRKLSGWNLKGAVAWDCGSLLGRSMGVMLSIGKTGIFNIRKR